MTIQVVAIHFISLGDIPRVCYKQNRRDFRAYYVQR